MPYVKNSTVRLKRKSKIGRLVRIFEISLKKDKKCELARTILASVYYREQALDASGLTGAGRRAEDGKRRERERRCAVENEKIIELLFARAEEALAALAAKYGALCYGIAWRVLESRQDAEECVNDTWLHTWNTIPPARPESLRAYVCRIARNLALDRLRFVRRRKRSTQMEVLMSELEECVPARDNVELEADDTAAQAVTSFLRTLDAQTRVLFVRRYFYMETVESLAERYGLNASSVSTRLTRVRGRLRAYLEREGVTVC